MTHHTLVIATDNEIDGETLIGINDRMIGQLFSTMKQQVAFSRELKLLMQSSVTHGYVASAQHLCHRKFISVVAMKVVFIEISDLTL